MSLCFCGNKENMKHIYECKYWNTEEPSEIYEKVYTGTMNQQIPLAPMGVLAPHLRTLDGSALPPIDTTGNFSAHVSAESPSSISPNPSEVISEVSEP